MCWSARCLMRSVPHLSFFCCSCFHHVTTSSILSVIVFSVRLCSWRFDGQRVLILDRVARKHQPPPPLERFRAIPIVRGRALGPSLTSHQEWAIRTLPSVDINDATAVFKYQVYFSYKKKISWTCVFSFISLLLPRSVFPEQYVNRWVEICSYSSSLLCGSLFFFFFSLSGPSFERCSVECL